MTATHLHLVLNHVPALGTVFTAALLAIALLRRNSTLQRVSVGFLLAFALAAIPVYLTGESAEERAERLPGVSEAMIERHEDAARVALIAVETLGGVALLGAALFRRRPQPPRAFTGAILGLTLVSAGLFGWTGYLGGRIRHPEIGAATTTAVAAAPAAHARRGHDDD